MLRPRTWAKRALALAGATAFVLLAAPALAYDGCLGAQVRDCLAAIQPHLSLQDYQAAQRGVDRYLAGDIAGHRKAHGAATLRYRSSFADAYDPPQILVLEYSAALAISQIEIALRPGALNAETEEDYRATHVYEAVLFALGSHPDCRELAQARDFYLFFHTKVRPKLRATKAQAGEAKFGPGDSFSGESGWIGLCGHKIQLSMSSAEWGAVQADMDRKYSAFMAMLAFR